MFETIRNTSFAILWLVVVLTGCSREVPPASPLDDVEVAAAIAAAPTEMTYRDEVLRQDRPGYEATRWITTNGNVAPFASNYFESRTQAVEFVRGLYRFGATKVYVVHIMDEPDRIRDEGGPYADALFAYLPSDPAQRRALFAIEAREAKADGFAPTQDTGQERLFFWWD